jgi:hypothetical protein
MITGQEIGVMDQFAPKSPQPHRWYYTGVGAGAIIISIAGFAPSLINNSGRLGPISSLVAVHALLSAAWLAIFVVQAGLVAKRRTAVHRRLGIASIALAVLILATGYTTVIEQTRRGYDLSGDLNIQSDPKLAAVFPLGDLVSFSVFLAAGLWHRRNPDVHRQLMTFATIGGLMPAALAHFVGHNLRFASWVLVPMVGFVFLAPAICDRIRLGRFERVTLWCGVALFVWANLRAMIIGPSQAWHHLIARLAR